MFGFIAIMLVVIIFCVELAKDLYQQNGGFKNE